MRRLPLHLGIGLAALFFLIAACIQEVERGGTPKPADSLPTVGLNSTSTPAPEPTATPVPTVTQAPTATPIPSPTPTATPAPTPTARPVPTLTPGPTSTPLPTPTPTPTPSPPENPEPQFILEVRAPRDGSTVRTDAVVVHGVTIPEVMVDIQGIPASVGPDGRFQAEVALSPGINTIQVIATDSTGYQEMRELSVTSLALPTLAFLLLITEPEDQSIISEPAVRLSGRTGPDATVNVNGVFVSVDELGFFFIVVSLEIGPNIIEVVANNNDGRELSQVIAVIYRP